MLLLILKKRNTNSDHFSLTDWLPSIVTKHSLIKNYLSNFYKPLYIFLLLIGLSHSKFTFSQSGNIFLKNYSPNINNISNMNISITQGNKGVMYFANPRGILSYDGIRWKLISVPSAPLVLASIPNNKRMFVGCRKDFGYIDFDKTGKEVYTSLSRNYSNIEGISKIVITKENIFFCSSDRLFCYSIRNKTIYQILSPNKEDQFGGFFSNNGKVFVNITGKGLYIVEGNKLCPLNTQILEHIILADIHFTNSSTFLYTEDNNCYVFDGLKLNPFKMEEEKYLKENVVTAGLEYSKDLFVLATLSGGCVIINKNTGKTEDIINYQTGLPDNEAYAIATDNLGGLWITHNYGITRADKQVPITNFSSYPGLTGNLTDIIKTKDKLYVATTMGVFVLSKSIYKTRLYYPEDNNETEEVCLIEKESYKKDNSVSIFRRITGAFKERKNKKKATNIEIIEPEKTNEKNIVQEEKSYKHKYHKTPLFNNHNYNPPFLQYGYEKIKGINKKCKQLLFCNGKLFAVTNTDLYEIKNGFARRVIKNRKINSAYVSSNYPNRIYMGTNRGILSFFPEKGSTSFKDLGINVYSIIEDDHFNVWAGGENQIVKIGQNKSGKLSNYDTYTLPTNHSGYVKVRNINGNLWFISNFCVYRYDSDRNIIIKDNELNLNSNTDKIIYSYDEYTWVYHDKFWNYYSKNPDHKKNKKIELNIFEKIRHIYIDSAQNCWIIDGNNLLYKVNNETLINPKNVDLHISEIRNSSGKTLPINNFVLNHDNSSMKFLITYPYYIYENSNQFQYILAGTMNDWSTWSKNKVITFPYLPSGRYHLKVRAKNVFEEVSENAGIFFLISPPYWLTWWFYLMETGSVLLLLSISIYFNKSNKSTVLSKSLMLLSVVIIFKFIQAMVESNISVSPVFDFSLSVIMVFFILKAEKVIISKLTKKTRGIKVELLRRGRRRMKWKAPKNNPLK